jgi:hypothetical protein
VTCLEAERNIGALESAVRRRHDRLDLDRVIPLDGLPLNRALQFASDIGEAIVRRAIHDWLDR